MRLFLVALVAMSWACGGGASPKSAPPGYRPAPAADSAARDAPAPTRVMTEAADDADFWGRRDEGESLEVRKSAPPPPPKSKVSIPRREPTPTKEPDTKGLEKPLVVYTGYLKLQVKRLLEAVDAISEMVDQAGGYIESLGDRVVVVRVPAGDFDAVMAAFAKVGTVLDRRVKALDVTAQYTDLRGRLAVAEETRARLLALLEQVTDTKERLRILQEIKRLTEQIESTRSTLATLENLVDFYTITLELLPVVEARRQVQHRSPFGWVRGLKAHLQTVKQGRDRIRLDLPEGFVLFEHDDVWRAQAADTTVLRAGVVDNEPRGTSAWWSDAVRHEMVGRDEEVVDEGDAAGLAWRIYRNKDVQPRAWLVGARAEGEDLVVVEAFFPDAEAFERHRAAVVEALSTLRVK